MLQFQSGLQAGHYILIYNTTQICWPSTMTPQTLPVQIWAFADVLLSHCFLYLDIAKPNYWRSPSLYSSCMYNMDSLLPLSSSIPTKIFRGQLILRISYEYTNTSSFSDSSPTQGNFTSSLTGRKKLILTNISLFMLAT